MAEVDLVSSHHPWTPVPQTVPWDEVGDGSVFAGQDTTVHDVLGDATSARQAYARSVAYSLRTVGSWPATVPDDDLVLLVLGDHQPHHLVSGPDPGRDVPVSIVTRDPAVLAAVAPWGWTPGCALPRTPRRGGWMPCATGCSTRSLAVRRRPGEPQRPSRRVTG
ncbi:hypothetical protein G7075_14900 [Phycicoccus sp. HDW14]|uniref:hypothetical protein n=1 Tax=Phycicoccus sp. HDW14 TaxID=2714941 RepID=UPI00140DBA81|nr:hypothetical protein [Phycicoccus sp. HDW14]QIM22127.1 hypothetical protein G7075_14900 [Phycicoccus sp. HDW14]